MPNEVLVKVGTQLTFADHALDFVGGAAGTSLEQAGSTDVQLNIENVADDAARQSAKFDLGATRARRYNCMAALEFAATPVADEVCEIYVAWSPDSTAANGNPGNCSGSDAAYTGYSANLDDSLQQLDLIGLFVTTAQATATVQVAHVGTFVPRERYGCLVFVNRSGAAMHSDAVECHIVFNPIVDEVQ